MPLLCRQSCGTIEKRNKIKDKKGGKFWVSPCARPQELRPRTNESKEWKTIQSSTAARTSFKIYDCSIPPDGVFDILLAPSHYLKLVLQKGDG